jgi:hypothetical protein
MDLFFKDPARALQLVNSPFFRVAAATMAMACIDQAIYSLFGRAPVPEEYKQARLRGQWRLTRRRRFNYLTRMLLDLASAAFFVVAAGYDLSWIDPLYRNHAMVITPNLFWPVRIFFELQIARLIFEMVLGPETSLTGMMVAVVRNMHVIIPLLLMMMSHGAGQNTSVVNLSFMAQMDLMQALVDFKAVRGPRLLQMLLPWSLVQIGWLVVRVCLPAYAAYRGHFGWFVGRGGYLTVVIFQFMLWFPLMTAGTQQQQLRANQYNPREARMARRGTGH